MLKINGIETFEGCHAALGRFDGLHKGHTSVIESVSNEKKVLLSIDKSKSDARLMTRDEWLSQLESMGVCSVMEPDFEDIKDMSPEEFVRDILYNGIKVKSVACGYNFRFGKNACADADELKALCNRYGIECAVVPKAMCEGEEISSTAIRRYIREGNAEQAEKMLGRPFGWKLVVERGQSLGRTLGAPTINQYFPKELIMPKFGVYASVTRLGSQLKYSVTNVGIRPTVGTDRPLSETWIPEFSGDLYGQTIEVRLLSYLRSEQKFDSIEDLRAAIHHDGECSQKIYDSRKQ